MSVKVREERELRPHQSLLLKFGKYSSLKREEYLASPFVTVFPPCVIKGEGGVAIFVVSG